MASIAETYGPAMSITDQAEADAYFARLVRQYMDGAGVGRVEAERVVRTNLGYYAGYYSRETRERVERLFLAQHPILGPAAVEHTPEEVFQAGVDWAKKKGGR